MAYGQIAPSCDPLSQHSDLYPPRVGIFLKMAKICHFTLKVLFSTISACIFNSINVCA